ncbi:uncharacterized protein At4g26485 [Brassica rapa]|uniref:BnaA01g35280D protein n=5 Tax=Brassica TaxID=3705 RepID=A0A078JSZ1_BRANA|nr:uncharacterized protein At4g26485 [Brassica rapa]XP_013742239.3 uncharacterized protein At4g26485 [Brassica napus]KAH0941969.1 hypothetical protein HID58_001606 [Brassica napus]CAF2150052.1 unnamed protein product [Brassica napus]CDY69949.1 BnaA01g35280D [Brassica napus]VDC75228.1 unnamed protein product [Brassica rapa]
MIVMEDSEIRIRHYSSKHKILLVGEGDFSFSLCLASAFGSATNITATSLDSEDELSKKYMDAMVNVSMLARFGCDVQHEVDVHTMSFDNSLSLRRYDRIVFNFPHAGSRFFGREFSSKAIEGHRVLVQGFLENAKEMLEENGEIHITHKTTYPFSDWEIERLAKAEGLKLAKESKFERSHYPGYNNKRGSGGRESDKYFPVGECSTLMFIQK